MKVAKIFAGMSALALAASMTAMTVSAEEAVSGSYYPATYDATYVYSGADIAAIAGDAVVDPDANALKDKKAQLVGYTNTETGTVDTYNLGFNIQVGHVTNAKLTIEVTSSANNIYDGNGGVGSGYMYTVQTSWNQDSPKDDEKGWKKFEYEDDGSQKMAWGACDINNMSTGPSKYNGEWAQITLTDTNVSALTFTVHVDCSESTWEYHPYEETDENGNIYQVFSMTAGTVLPNNVDASQTQEADTGKWAVVSSDEINKQIPGGKTSGKEDSKSDSSSSTTDSNSSTTSSNSSSTSSTTSTTSKSGSSTTSKASTTGGSTSTSASTAASDNTENAASGAAAGVGLAIAALAGAAIVVSRKK